MLLPQAVAIGAAAAGATAATTARVGDDGEVCDGGGGGGGDDGVSDLAGHAGPGRDRKPTWCPLCQCPSSNSLDNNNSTASCCFYISLG